LTELNKCLSSENTKEEEKLFPPIKQNSPNKPLNSDNDEYFYKNSSDFVVTTEKLIEEKDLLIKK